MPIRIGNGTPFWMIMSTSRSINIWTYLSTGEKTRSTSFLENSFNPNAKNNCFVKINQVKNPEKETIDTTLKSQGSVKPPDKDEQKIYKMLQGKIDTHTKLVDLYKEELAE